MRTGVIAIIRLLAGVAGADSQDLLRKAAFRLEAVDDAAGAERLLRQFIVEGGGDSAAALSEAKLRLAACLLRQEKTDLAREILRDSDTYQDGSEGAFNSLAAALIPEADHVSPEVIGQPVPLEYSLREQLDNIIIPKIKFSKATPEAVFAYFRQRSRELDPEKVGVNLVLTTSKTGDRSLADASVTMDFDNIPVGEAVRYLANDLGLRYKLDQNVLVLFDDGVALDPMETRIFPLRADYFIEPEVRRDPFEAEDDELDTNAGGRGRNVNPRAFFEQFGVRFPKGASIAYVGLADRLVVTNTAEELRKIERLTKELTPNPTQIQVTCEVVELPEGSSIPLGHVMQKETDAAQGSYTFRRDASWQSLHSMSAMSRSAHESRDHRINGETPGDQLVLTPTTMADGYTLDLQLEWRRMSSLGGQPRMQEIETRLLLWDGETIVVPLANPESANHQYLLITAYLLIPSGHPIRAFEYK